MREVIVRFPTHALDDVLDRILPIVPDGVREALLATTTRSQLARTVSVVG